MGVLTLTFAESSTTSAAVISSIEVFVFTTIEA